MNNLLFLRGALIALAVLALMALPVLWSMPGVMTPNSWIGRVIKLAYFALLVMVVAVSGAVALRSRRKS